MTPALLVIDLQRWFLEVGPPEKLARVEQLVAKTNELMDFFHRKRSPVVHVQTIHDPNGSSWNQWMKRHHIGRLIAGTRAAEAYPGLHIADGDLWLRKTRHSAFIRTDLERILREQRVDTVILAGFSTNACVGLSAIEAWERDFNVVLAGEAVLGTNVEEGDLMLDYLRRRFEIEPVSNARICQCLE